MKIAFMHYHLKIGGVTSVLRQQVKAIGKTCEVLVLTGEDPESDFPGETACIPGLGYTAPTLKFPTPETVAESIIHVIQARWKTGCDVLHVHNPLLSKNKQLLKILKILQDQKINLFLQIHDFAEDGRPLAYYQEAYPADCHYGVINSRDYGIMLKSDLKADGIHKIFNMVRHLESPQKTMREHRVLYPIRAIRRKNIGEAILLSLFFRPKETLSITLPPNSASDMKSYAEWKKFVKDKNLNVEFESGLTHAFESLVNSSRFLLSTSITEGFGFQFLEPWTADKMLFGRKLPGICDDFENNGVRLDHLYPHLLVPIEWIGIDRLHKKWKSTVLDICSQYNHKIHPHDIDNAFADMIRNDRIDFGLLDESFQKQVIIRIVSDKKNQTIFMSLNPFLHHFGEESFNEALIQENKKTVLSHYNETNYRKTLLSIYQKIINNPVTQRIDKKALLSQFLDLTKFSLLKWGKYPDSEFSG